MTVSFRTDDADNGMRPDRVLRRHHPAVDRDFALKLLREGRILVDGQEARLQTRVVPERTIIVHAPAQRLGPARVELRVLFHDRGLVVVDKPAGMATHAGTGVDAAEETVVSAVEARFAEGAGDGTSGVTASCLGRLDRKTSGLMVVALTHAALQEVLPGWNSGEIRKEYVVVVHGKPPPEGRVEIPLASRRPGHRGSGRVEEAITSFTTVGQGGGVSVVVAELHTGRTHQIRRHMKAIGHPIVGDDRYGHAQRDATLPPFQGLMLHSWRVRHPGVSSVLPVACEAPWPKRMIDVLSALNFNLASTRATASARA